MIKDYLKNSAAIGPFVRLAGEMLRNAKDNRRIETIRKQNESTLKRNSSIKNLHAGQKCFLLATGPSMKGQDLKPLTGKLSISVSNFFVHPDFKIIRPEFHIFASSHKPISVEQMVAWFKDAEKHFPEEQKVLVSVTDKYIVEQHNIFKKQNVFYYLSGNRNLEESNDIDLTKEIPSMKTVTHLALYIAFYLGCNSIYLVGCDHNWAEVPGQNMHFYEEKQHVIFGLNRKDKPFDMQDRFKGYYNLWDGYKKIRNYCGEKGINIWNCTPGSLLDVFPRQSLEKAANNSQAQL